MAAAAAVHRIRNECRACGGNRMRSFLSLGPAPLANAFLHSTAELSQEPTYPLDVHFCEGCSLVQLRDVIDPGALFRNYIYTSGVSDTIARHYEEYAATLAGALRLGPRDLVVEVASNDGSLLRCFQPYGVSVLGVEPAANIAEIARERGVPTIDRFFDSECGRQIREQQGPARTVIANNVLAHVDDPVDFLRGMKALVAEDGLVVLEFPYLRDLLERLEYDTIYHEHLCYFSVTALMRLFSRAGLSIVRVDRVPIHGGSLRVFATHAGRRRGHAASVQEMAREESGCGMSGFDRFQQFADQVRANRDALVRALEGLNREGRRVAAYGAPAKGNTLLNFCRIDTNLISFTVDKSPLKVGTYTPGSHIPVLPVSALVEKQPDDVLILAWNFADEIVSQQSEYRKQGGRFLVPIPEPRAV